MSTERRLRHVVSTNAPGAGGAGFRTILDSFDGPEADGKRVGKWLDALKVAPGTPNGWAANVFSIGGSQHAALALVQPGFALDEHGRSGGHLAHALLFEVSERERAGDFGLALFEKAREFIEFEAATIESKLDKYLDGCRLATDLGVPAIEPSGLRHLGPGVLLEFLQASRESTQPPEVAFSGIAEDSLAECLVRAGAALPPKLRLNLRWGVGLEAAPEKAFLARAAQAAGPASRVFWNDGAQLYRDWLWKRLEIGRLDEVKKIVQRWDITSWPQLLEAITLAERAEGTAEPPVPIRAESAWAGPPPVATRPEPLAQVSEQLPIALPPTEATAEKEITEVKRRAGGGPKLASATRDAAEYEQEYQAMQDSLRKHLESRLELLGVPPAADGPAPATGGGRPGHRNRVLAELWRWRPEIYLGLALVLFGWLWWSRPPQADGQLEPLEEVFAGKDPLGVWHEYLRTNAAKAAPWFQAVAEARGLEPSQVNGRQKAKFKTGAEQLRKGEQLGAEEARDSAIGLFEYVYARWATDKKIGDPSIDIVTLNPDEANRHLKDFVTDLDLADQLGADLKSTDPKVQVAVVLKRMKQAPQMPFEPAGPGPEPETPVPPAPGGSVDTAVIDAAVKSPDPIAFWREHLRTNAAKAEPWFRAVAAAEGLEAEQVSAQQKPKFTAWADKLAKGEELTSEEARASATGLFEYVHARWAVEAGRGRPGEDIVTLDPDEADRHLSQFVTSLGLADRLGPALSSTDSRTQVAVVLKSMEQGDP